MKPLRERYKHIKNTLRMLGIIIDQYSSKYRHADISIFHTFHPPPYGGGNQFLLALREEFERRDLRLENNIISHTTRACLFNSYNFDFERLRRLSRENCQMVHRVDGPLGVYHGWDDGSDKRIWQINQELADATIFQSQYSYQKHLELGFEFQSPNVIMNAANPRVFYANNQITLDRRRKIRLISVSWSDNPNKGAETYKWIEDNLNWDSYEYTFVGRSPIQFESIKIVNPLPSRQLSDLLRNHDVFVTASRHDPCSNALIEALSCGLPAIYLNSGGHSEIVRKGGLGFHFNEEILDILDQMVEKYEYYQNQINLPTISKVAEKYLTIMGIME